MDRTLMGSATEIHFESVAGFEPGPMFAKFLGLSERRKFYLVSPAGEFVLFTGKLADRLDWPAWSEEASLGVSDVEIVERGNVFDRQGSD